MQPLIDAGISFRHGKRLTFAEMHKIKKDVVLHADGTLTPRRRTCEDYLSDNPVWATRQKAWLNLQNFGRFKEVAAKTGIPLTDIDYAARWGNQNDFRCDELDWAAILAATEELIGVTAKRNKKAHRESKRRDRQRI